MITPIVKRCAGLDVHKMVVMVTVLLEQDDGSITEELRQFGTFRKHRRQMVRWLKRMDVQLAVMESTGIFWKSIFASLEEASINTYVVNARHVKKVPGRKTDVSDSQWLATLARMGLLNPSFIPSKDFRELRLITRQRTKLKGMLAAQTNRLHKVLDDAGVRLGGVVSDINGVNARKLIQGLIEGIPVEDIVANISGRMKKKIPELIDALDEPLGQRHLYLLESISQDIRYFEKRLSDLDAYLLEAMVPYQKQLEILQTIPGIDITSAILLLVEIGTQMDRFESKDRLASWAGMCPGNNESAGKQKQGRSRKGNQAVRRILSEIANAAYKTKSQFKGYYQGLVIRRGYKRAIVATGHKILRVVFVLLKNLKPYKDPGIDYKRLVVERNAPRWLSALKKYGFLSEIAQTA
jgi:transposase